MAEWQSDGPDNGTEMLVLLPDEKRIVALFDGLGQAWMAGPNVIPKPVAWAPIPPVPPALRERNRQITEDHAKLVKIASSPLSAQAIES